MTFTIPLQSLALALLLIVSGVFIIRRMRRVSTATVARPPVRGFLWRFYVPFITFFAWFIPVALLATILQSFFGLNAFASQWVALAIILFFVYRWLYRSVYPDWSAGRTTTANVYITIATLLALFSLVNLLAAFLIMRGGGWNAIG